MSKKLYFVNLGEKYNHWTVLELLPKNRCLCQCDCEKRTIREVSIPSIVKGKSTSCGCSRIKHHFKIGDKYGHWTIIGEKIGDRCLCQCDCKNKTTREVNIYELTGGRSTSCGCANRPQLNVGDKFAHLTVIELDAKKDKYGAWLHKCQCDCEDKTICYRSAYSLFQDQNHSCGCANPNAHNGLYETGTKFNKAWQAMRKRCSNPSHASYKDYGGRGIKVCERWEKYLNFREDMYESFCEHIKKHGSRNTSLDRIDVNGDYCPENCRWATCKEQSNNRRVNTYITDERGITHTIAEWAEIKSINYTTLQNRISSGWDITEALNKEVQKHEHKKS